jgi:peptide/nickel transport system substrate-binding protein
MISRRDLALRVPLSAVMAGLASGISLRELIRPQPAWAAPAGVVIDAFTQEAVNFNPLLYINTGVETAVEYSVFDALWKIDPQGQLVPNLATEIPSVENGGISKDGLEWQFKLRPDVHWQDGQPFTSKDVIFTLQTLLNPKVVVRSRNGQDIVQDYVAPDAHTVKIRLKSVFAPYLISWLVTSIVPEHILASEPDINTAHFNSNPVGTGPFIFKDRVAGDHILFVPNSNYHGVKSTLTSLIQKYVPDQQTLYTQFRTGDVTIYDYAGLPVQLFKQAKALPNTEVTLTPGSAVEFVYFNCSKPQFREKVVRQALYLAMDKQSWINVIYYGLRQRTLSFLPPSHWAYNHALVDPGYNPAKAARMLDDAGWRVGDDGIRQKDGVKLAFSMSTTAGNKAREDAQQLLQQNFKDINVAMTIKNMPASVVWGDYTVKSLFDTLMVGWGMPLYPDPDYTDHIASFRNPLKTGAGVNYFQYENPKIDELCIAGTATTDRAARKAIYDQIQAILLDDMPIGPIFADQKIAASTTALKGYIPNSYVPINSWNNSEWRI